MRIEDASKGAARIASFVSDFPPARRAIMARNFDGLGSIPHEQQGRLLPQLYEFIELGEAPDEHDTMLFSADRQTLSFIVTASTLLLSFLRGEESVEDILDGLQIALSLHAETVAALRDFLILLTNHRKSLDLGYERNQLAMSTMPSLTRATFSVDLRARVKEDRVNLVVPVVLAHIDTDGDSEEIWFQLTKGQLNKLRRDLDRVAGKLQVLEIWADQKNETVSTS